MISAYNTIMKKYICLLLTVLFLLASLPVAEAAEESARAEDLSSKCTYEISFKASRAVASLKDDNTETYQKFKADASLTISWPDSLQPSFIYVQWTTLPESYSFTEYDSSGKKLSETESSPFRFNEVLYLTSGTTRIVITSKEGMSLTTCRVFGAGDPPEDFRPFEPIPEKIDYLIIAMHPDDDVLFMGGIVPTLREKGLTGAIVYMGTRVRERCDEALNGAWIMGMEYHPILAGFPDIPNTSYYYDKFQNTFRVTDAEKYVVGIIRRYKPEIVFTHDTEGEYGHWQHKRLSKAVQLAVVDAADPNYDKDSAELYGTYEVKKCYLHLYPKNTISISMTVPLSTFGGRTAFEIATEAFTCHSSQQNGNHSVTNEGIYSLENFGLFYSTVGLDEKGDDFFEHVDPSLLTFVPPEPTPSALPTAEPTAEPTPEVTPSPEPTAEPTPEPTAEPTQEPTEVPTAEPTHTPAPTDGSVLQTAMSSADARTSASGGGAIVTVIWVLAGLLVLTVFLFIVVLLRKRK